MSGAIGQFIASSREDPRVSVKGNLKLNDRGKIYTVRIGEKECSMCLMEVTENVESGQLGTWDYNWSVGCDYVLPDKKNQEGSSVYGSDPTEIEYVRRLIIFHLANHS